MNIPQRTEILIRLVKFLEHHNNTKIPADHESTLKMHIAHAQKNKKTNKKDIIINFLLAKLQELILDQKDPTADDMKISLFLISELEEFYKNTLKK